MVRNISLAAAPPLEPRYFPLHALLIPLRNTVSELCEQQPGDFEAAYWIARTLAGVSFARKRKITTSERRLVLLLAASSLEKALEELEIEHPYYTQPAWISWPDKKGNGPSNWRPQLRGWLGKMFNRVAERALPAVGIGLVVEVGQVGEQRLALPRKILRMEGKGMSEHELKKKTLAEIAKTQQDTDINVMDAGVKISECQDAGIKHFLMRLASNCTARRNYLPQPPAKGRPPEYGQKVRPLARTRQGKTIAASQADVNATFTHQGRVIRVQGWRDLILPHLKPDPSP